jgi:hypothetical protein
MKRFLSLSFALCYVAVIVWSVRYNFLPLIAHYGAWNWLGMNALFAVLGFITAILAMICFEPKHHTPKPPMATYKEPTS